jgi:endonuclease/exonuclease/phosphatase family metal-dependent hydrolase
MVETSLRSTQESVMQPYSSIPPRGDRAGVVRVLTCNIYNTEGNWAEREPLLKGGLAALDPDVMAFQETVLTDAWDQVRAIVGDGYEIVHSRHREPGAFGVSIASRWPIHRVGELDFDVSPRAWTYAATALLAEIEAPAPIGTLYVVNHFPDYQPSHEWERERQTLMMAGRLEERVREKAGHVVVMGDLDAEPDAASLRFLAGRQSLDDVSVCYRNAWASRHLGERCETFTMRNALVAAAENWDWPFREIDHIFVRCGDRDQPSLAIRECELAFDKPVDGVWGSDHIGLVADLGLPPR